MTLTIDANMRVIFKRELRILRFYIPHAIIELIYALNNPIKVCNLQGEYALGFIVLNLESSLL